MILCRLNSTRICVPRPNNTIPYFNERHTQKIDLMPACCFNFYNSVHVDTNRPHACLSHRSQEGSRHTKDSAAIRGESDIQRCLFSQVSFQDVFAGKHHTKYTKRLTCAQACTSELRLISQVSFSKKGSLWKDPYDSLSHTRILSLSLLQTTATHSNTLQYTTTYCRTLQKIVTAPTRPPNLK